MDVSVAKMKACSVAIRPTSRMKKAIATGKRDPAERRDPEQHGQPAAHEQDQQVAGEDVGEQSHRQRDDPHELRDHLDEEDRDRRGGRSRPRAASP